MNIKQIYEYRGTSERLNKDGKKLYLLNFEGENGEGTQFYCRDEKIASSLNKGTRYVVGFSISGNSFLNSITPIK